MTSRLPITSDRALKLLLHPNCLPADPQIPFGVIVLTEVSTAELVLSLGERIWCYRGDADVAFGHRRELGPHLQDFMAAQKLPKPDPRRLATVLRHAKTTLLTDCPRRLMRVTFDEAELLASWDCPVSVWGNLETQTFWCRPEDFPALLALREIRRLES